MARVLDRMAHEELKDHTDSPSIATDILVNVNRPWRPQGCKCTEIMNQIRGAGSGWCPPCTNGHIFFTGREYQGPKSSCLTNHNINIPAPSNWDLKRAWERVISQLPMQEISEGDLECLHIILYETFVPVLLHTAITGPHSRRLRL